MEFTTSLKGEYRLVVTHSDGSTTDTDWFDNMILNQGLDKLGSDNETNVCYRMHIGTGTTTPDVTQIGLVAPVAAVAYQDSNARTQTAFDPVTRSRTHTCKFPFVIGAVVGNMTEIGVSDQSAANELFSRALIVDGSGVPTALTITATDQLTAYYKLTITAPTLSDASGSVTLAGTAYPYTVRPLRRDNMFNDSFIVGGWQVWQVGLNVYDHPFTLVPITDNWGAWTGEVYYDGYYNNHSTKTVAPYVPGTYRRDTTFGATNQSNNPVGGIGGMVIFIGNVNYYQVKFTNPIPKNATNSISLTIRTSWARG